MAATFFSVGFPPKQVVMSQSQIYFLSRTNAPAKWFGHTLTNQGQRSLIPSSSLELFFLALFGSHDKSGSTQLAAKKDLSPVLCYGHSTWKNFIEDHADAATSYKLKDQHTNRRHQK